MSLRSWLASRWLVEHEATAQEIRDLLAVVDRDLRDSALVTVSADWRLSIAYNAALQLATLALAAAGYRPGRERPHERTIQSLRLTIRADAALVDTIEAVRRKRNISHYDRAGAASDKEAAEVHRLAKDLRASVVKWLEKHHQGLLRP